MSSHDTRLAKTSSDLSIAVGGSFTVDPILQFLDSIVKEASPGLSVEIGPYGQLFESLLDPSSLMRCKTRLLNVILLKPSDLSEGPDRADAAADELLQAVQRYSENCKTPLLLVLTPEPDGKHHQQRRLAKRLHETGNIYVLDEDRIATLYPVQNIHDRESNRAGHIPYTESYYAALAIHITRFAWRINKPEKKVIVLDCDNTLWNGVCGELGPSGVELTAEHKGFQQHILDLADQGMLLCLNSKNAEQDVMAVFEQNTNMILRKDHLAAWQINWNSKSRNIRALAAHLDLSSDSFVFVDDNPMEIAEVRSACPEVLCIQLPKDELQYSARLQHCWALDKHRVTDADKSRTRSYQENMLRSSLENSCDDFEEFLKKLELEVNIQPLKADDCERVVQISQRTNQFNTTTLRQDTPDVQRMLTDANPSCYTVRVRDRFGDYGLVGVVSFQCTDSLFLVDSLMLSCRVLAKGVEHAVLRYVAKIAKASNFGSVVVEYRETSRNVPARHFLESIEHVEHRKGFLFDTERLCALEYSGHNRHDQSSPNQTVAVDSSQHDVLELGWRCRDVQQIVSSLKRLKERPSIADSYVAPKAGLEQRLAHIWGECLRIRTIGRNDRFNELGGTSLELVRVHSAIKKDLGRDIDLAVLLRMPSIALLAQHLERKGADSNMAAARDRARKQRTAVKQRAERNARKEYE